LRIRRRKFIVALAAGGLAAAFLILTRSRESPEQKGQRDIGSIEVRDLVTGLEILWSIAFVSESEALVTERPGRVRLIDLNTGRSQILGTVEVAHVGEGGLLGCELLRPGPRILLYRTVMRGGSLANVLTVYDDLTLRDGVDVLGPVEGASVHDGGRVRLGPDGNVYVTTGDARRPELSQRLDSLAGKILRIRPDGNVPSDNPFPGSPVYSLGHRNPQGITWSPKHGRLFATEHGPTGEFGAFARDELNLIVPGGNYGWPHVIGRAGDPRYIDPVLESGDETWAPSGCDFCTSSDLPELKGCLLFAALRGTALHAVRFDEEEMRPVEHFRLLQGTYGRLRDVRQGPDGSLYVLTSNRDGRGAPRPGDDRVLVIGSRR
jgi:glucose/arabinose dehydrogenase